MRARARLNTEGKNHEKEAAAYQAVLVMATAIGEKQLADFNAEEMVLLESLSVLMSVVTVLSNHIGATAFLKVHRSLRLGVAATLRNDINKYALHLKEREAENKHKGYCIDYFNTNQLQTEYKDCVKRDWIAKNVDLEMITRPSRPLATWRRSSGGRRCT